MGPLPDDLKKVIMSYHPGLTESQFSRYVSLVDKAHMIDPLKYPDRKKEAEKEVSAYVKMYMPRLGEAMKDYNSKIEAQYEESVKNSLADPVEIAKRSKTVREWLSGRAGQCTITSRLIEEPYTYMVVFKATDGSEMHVKVDRYNRTLSVIFRRIVGNKA
jgi:hypothetical protein